MEARTQYPMVFIIDPPSIEFKGNTMNQTPSVEEQHPIDIRPVETVSAEPVEESTNTVYPTNSITYLAVLHDKYRGELFNRIQANEIKAYMGLCKLEELNSQRSAPQIQEQPEEQHDYIR